MKLFLMGLVLSLAPPWVSIEAQRPTAVGTSDAPCRVICKKLGLNPTQAKTVSVRADVSAPNTRVVQVTASAKDDRTSEPRTLVISASSAEKKDKQRAEKREKQGGAFLGVSLGDVPEALRTQLDLKVDAVMVLNVAEDSPAAKGGLEVHDVILAFDGETVKDEPQAADAIRSRQPGEAVTLKVLRKGKEKTLHVTLGAREELEGKDLQWRVEETPKAEVEESVRTYGKLLRKGPKGEWKVENLGDLHELQELPKHLQMFLPKRGSRCSQVFVEDGKKKIKTKLEQDGESIEVEQDKEGEITVVREKDGKKTESTYSSADELRQADEEAAHLLDELNDSVVVRIDGPGEFDFQFDLDKDVIDEHMKEWRENFDDGLREAMEEYHKAMDEFQRAMEEWRKSAPPGSRIPPIPQRWFGRGEDEGLLSWLEAGPAGSPKHSFEVREDGKIEARIRQGDTEVVKLFENEKDMKQRGPSLFEKYQRVMSAGEKE
jgi:hypothetical protein